MAEIFKNTSHILSLIMTTILDNLPREKWFRILELHQWQGFWYLFPHLEATIASQSHFQACDNDVLLASSMKTGTTWLKALIPCIMHSISDDDKDPLIMNHPNALMPSLEVQLYRGNPSPDLSSIPSPRLLRTHLPYAALPKSITKSNCKIVYISRNPKDTLISLWHFMNNSKPPGVDAVSLEVAFKSFCNGVHAFGPFFDHVLDYWKQSLDNPQKILFMKFEEMKSDPKGQVKKLAAFLGKPFTNDEEAEKVLYRCSLERLKNLEVNKTGIDPCIGVPNSSYFRKGIVGDWKNYFTQEMREELDEITRIRLLDSGLEF